MDARLKVITPGVKDFSRSLACYRDGLGGRAEVQDDIAFFPLSGIVFTLYPRDSRAKDASVPAEKTGFPKFTLAYLAR
jgi:uncharacterized protein